MISCPLNTACSTLDRTLQENILYFNEQLEYVQVDWRCKGKMENCWSALYSTFSLYDMLTEIHTTKFSSRARF